jgi:hypothetical protein
MQLYNLCKRGEREREKKEEEEEMPGTGDSMPIILTT